MTRTGLALILAACAWLGCRPALGAAWFSWTDTSGRSWLTAEQPPAGVPFTQVPVPDDIRWRSAPDMPMELPADRPLAPPQLFALASPSVYWVVRARPRDQGPGFVYGSAVAVTDDTAITNCHVVGSGDDDVTVGSGADGETGRAELVAASYASDRCVLRVHGMALHPVRGVRRFDDLAVGETVYAIGNPRRLERTLSEGLVSGRRAMGQLRLVQTTAPISPGSSGGGLFDGQGNLIGITTSSLRGAQSINFAIPAEDFWH